MATNAINILIVGGLNQRPEDLRKAFETAGIQNPLHFAKDGNEALTCLEGNGLPGFNGHGILVMVNHDLPDMSGIDLLSRIRRNPDHGSIPVILWAKDPGNDLIEKAYKLHVAGLILIPDSTDDLTEKLRVLAGYWEICEF